MDYSPEDRCKIEPIQSQVALLLGWKDALNILPTMLSPNSTVSSVLLIMYNFRPIDSAAAWSTGRLHWSQKVLLLSLLDCFLSDCWVRLIYWFPKVFPVALVLESGVWCLIGGGPTTLTAMMFVTVADKSHPSKRTLTFS
jgi:hypothetical protein